jgi:hypothetical protein
MGKLSRNQLAARVARVAAGLEPYTRQGIGNIPPGKRMQVIPGAATGHPGSKRPAFRLPNGLRVLRCQCGKRITTRRKSGDLTCAQCGATAPVPAAGRHQR